MGFKLKIAYNTTIQIIGKIFSSLQTLLITALIARVFGVSGYGDFTKISSYVPLFYMMADFGLNAIFIRESDKEINKEYFSNLFTFRFFLSIILVFIAISILAFLPYSPKTNQGFSHLVKLGIIIASLEILLKGIFTSTNAVFQKKLRYDLSVIALVIGSLTTLLIVYFSTRSLSLMASLGLNSLLLIIIAYLFGDFITGLLSIFFVKKIIGPFHFRFDFLIWRKMFFSALPLAITLIFNLIYFRIDTFILTIYRSTTEVGLYGLAYRFFEALLVIPTFFMNSLYPVMTERANNRENLKQLIKKGSIILFVSSIILTILTFYLSPLLINLIGGEEFTGAVLSLKILAISFPLFFLSVLFMWVLITLKKPGFLAIFYGLSMVLNIILNLLFIPKYGYLAASVVTGLTEAFVLILTAYTSLKYLND